MLGGRQGAFNDRPRDRAYACGNSPAFANQAATDEDRRREVVLLELHLAVGKETAAVHAEAGQVCVAGFKVDVPSLFGCPIAISVRQRAETVTVECADDPFVAPGIES